MAAMLVLSLAVVGLLLAAVTLAVRIMVIPDRVVAALALLSNGFVLAGAMLWPVVIATVLLVVAVSVWPPRPGRRRAFHLASVAAVVVGVAVPVVRVWPEQREFARLRALYPFESLAERVPVRPASIPSAFGEPALRRHEYDLEHRLGDGGWSTGRSLTLKRLHEDQVDLFVNSPGFGVVRTIRGRPTATLLGEPRPPDHSPDPPLETMARDDALDFADPARWGYRRGDRVAGFLPHALRRQPGPARGWVVEGVELVGLLLAPDPRVYVSDRLPRMDELRGGPTRHLEGFELPALAELRAGREIVTDPAAGRMLGAVRAAKQCLSCHGGERGDLLGAFSYRLRPR